MKMSPICRKVSRCLCIGLLLMASGSSTFVMSGCDPQVTTIILGGFQSLSTTFVDAFFTLLANQAATDQGTTGTTGTTGTST